MKLYKIQSETSQHNGRIVVTELSIPNYPKEIMLATPTKGTELFNPARSSELQETTLEENKWVTYHICKEVRPLLLA